jgi:uncharacterized protein YhaN
VRIDRVQVDGFGRLVALDTGAEPLDGLVVVLGPNEAGKSTLFAFLTSALYGFQPATREGNPHVPWGSAEAAGRIRLRLDAGGCADVERRLRSQPSGRMTVAGVTTELRNQPLAWVEHVPRGVFRQVFAVTLSELAGLDGDTWARIQDKVVGSMGASDLRSARVAADALEREAGEIWRPSRRGNQRLRDLQRAVRDQRARRSAALERNEQVRVLVREREDVRARLDAAYAERRRDRIALDRVQTLLPLKQQLDRVAALRAEGGDRRLLAGLPPDPAARLAALRADLDAARARRAALAAELAENTATAARFDDRARTLLERRDDVAGVVARAAGCSPDRARAHALEGRIGELETRLDAAGARLLEGSWREQAGALTDVRVDVLEDRLARTAPPPPPSPAQPAGAALALVAALAGVAILLWGLLADVAAASALGGALLAVGTLLWAARKSSAGLASRDAAPSAPHEDPLALLRGVRLRAEHQRLGTSLLEGLAHVQGMLRERDEHQRALTAASARVGEADAHAVELARQLGLEAPSERRDADTLAAQLDGELRRAERNAEAALHAERESRRLRREQQAAEAALASLEAQVADLVRRGAAIHPGDATRGLEAARARLASHRRADELEAELQLRHPDLAELERQTTALGDELHEGRLAPHDVAALRARMEATEEEILGWARRAEALEQRVHHLRDMETVDAVDSETAALRDAESRLARERDRKWVLANILREADRRFREEHQPDLLRRAGSYLAHLTGGRYDRLVVDETESGHLFHLVGPGLPAPVRLSSPMSTGTLEQAYLALRLAIVDHLDRGGERLPLFVDEVFVNWDAERRRRGIDMLAGISAKRQVFVFTCHPSLAEQLGTKGARVLELGGVD